MLGLCRWKWTDMLIWCILFWSDTWKLLIVFNLSTSTMLNSEYNKLKDKEENGTEPRDTSSMGIHRINYKKTIQHVANTGVFFCTHCHYQAVNQLWDMGIQVYRRLSLSYWFTRICSFCTFPSNKLGASNRMCATNVCLKTFEQPNCMPFVCVTICSHVHEIIDGHLYNTIEFNAIFLFWLFPRQMG